MGQQLLRLATASAGEERAAARQGSRHRGNELDDRLVREVRRCPWTPPRSRLVARRCLLEDRGGRTDRPGRSCQRGRARSYSSSRVQPRPRRLARRPARSAGLLPRPSPRRREAALAVERPVLAHPGQDADGIPLRPPFDIVARPDPEALGDRLGNGDLQLARDLGHVLTLARRPPLSMPSRQNCPGSDPREAARPRRRGWACASRRASPKNWMRAYFAAGAAAAGAGSRVDCHSAIRHWPPSFTYSSVK